VCGSVGEIIKGLGTPTREEIKAMNSNYTEFNFPQIKAHPWNKVRGKPSLPPSLALLFLTDLAAAPSLPRYLPPSLPPSLRSSDPVSPKKPSMW